MSDTKTYKVLGIEGEVIPVNGKEYHTGDVIKLTDAEAAAPLAESRIELTAETAGPVEQDEAVNANPNATPETPQGEVENTSNEGVVAGDADAPSTGTIPEAENAAEDAPAQE